MIKEFRGDTRWLSNFYWAPLTYYGLYVPTNEHAFQLAKAVDPLERQNIGYATTPSKAKKLGRVCQLRPEWEKIKDDVMLEITILKFVMHEDLRKKLLGTGDQELLEGNTWGDTYWGVDLHTLEGRNQLGKTLMEVRRLLG